MNLTLFYKLIYKCWLLFDIKWQHIRVVFTVQHQLEWALFQILGWSIHSISLMSWLDWLGLVCGVGLCPRYLPAVLTTHAYLKWQSYDTLYQYFLQGKCIMDNICTRWCMKPCLDPEVPDPGFYTSLSSGLWTCK